MPITAEVHLHLRIADNDAVMFTVALTPRALLLLLFLIAVGILQIVSKLIEARVRRLPPVERRRFLLMAPSSYDAWRQRRPARRGDWPGVLGRLALFGGLTGTTYALVWQGPAMFNPGPILRAYLFVIPFWVFFEAVSAALEGVLLCRGIRVPPLLDAPYRSRSLREFWGQRWNPGAAAGLKRLVFLPLRSRPHLAVFATFLVSGLVHDIVINGPGAVAYGLNLFGSMTAYFLIQAIGLLVERAWLRNAVARWIVTWVVVIGPVPLMLNGSLLRILLWV